MHTDFKRDDMNCLAGLAPVVSEPLDKGVISIGDVLAGIVLPDLAVRMRGQFDLPRLVALTAWED